MREILIGKNDAGQRIDKFLSKYMADAPTSFFYKMLRKKNITLNGKRTEGNDRLLSGDVVRFYMSDETIDKFIKTKEVVMMKRRFDIIYEDENIMLVNKPAGILSQKADKDDISINEMIVSYFVSEKKLDKEYDNRFTPSICNRLDRNTSGLITAGKSLLGLQELSRLFRERLIEKYYYCLVTGQITENGHMMAYIKKDKDKNIVKVIPFNHESDIDMTEHGCDRIEAEYEPEKAFNDFTLLKVKLITGKTHQIRAHFGYMGHPVVGDNKYGNRTINRIFKQKHGLNHQLLHASMLSFPEMNGEFCGISKKSFRAELPDLFKKIIRSL